MAKRLELKVMTGELAGKVLSVPDGGLRLGRSSSNDVCIVDEELSRNHCIFEPDGESAIRVIDLASANGTYVNGKALGSAPQTLKAGDRIEVGSTLVHVVGAAMPAAAPVVVDLPAKKDREPAPGRVVDLGLGPSAAEDAEAAKPVEPVSKGRKVANLLWAGAVTALVVAIFLILTNDGGSQDGRTRRKPASTSSSVAAGGKAEKPDDAGDGTIIVYERVTATAEKVSRYCVEVRGVAATLAYDSMSAGGGDGQKVDESGKLSDWARKELGAIFDSADWLSLESSSGQASNALRSWRIKAVRNGMVREVVVENTTPSRSFSAICDKLETLFNNDLGVQLVMRSPEECLDAARKSEALGDDFYDKREVEPQNLWRAIKSYSQAGVELKGVSGYDDDKNRMTKKVEDAEALLRERYGEVHARAERAKQIGDWTAAREAYDEIRAMIPDALDHRAMEAESNIRDIEGRIATEKDKRKKGGRE